MSGLLHLLHLAGVLHYLRAPNPQAFCLLGDVKALYHGHVYCVPQTALEVWLRR